VNRELADISQVRVPHAGPNDAVPLPHAPSASWIPFVQVLPSLTPSYLNSRTWTSNLLHVLGWTSNILALYHSIDHRCLGRLHQSYWNRPLQESLCCRHRKFKFSRSYFRTTPRTRKGIQGISRWGSETDRLPPPSSEGYSLVLWHPQRGGQPGEPHIPPDHSFSDFVRSLSHPQTLCLLASILFLLYVP
jgi:hypothetical protein